MKIDKDFTFSINISGEGYTRKTDATACLTSKGASSIHRKKMCFFEHQVSVDEFIYKALLGHSFCALYRFEPETKYFYKNNKGQSFHAYPYYRRDTTTATKGGLKLDFKRDEYFYASQVIFIDIDFTHFTSIPDYISCMTYKPTCVYMSYSDNKNKNGITSRRFHLVYVFDSLLDSNSFRLISSSLSNQLVRDTNEELDDDCGRKMSQYFNGCNDNKEYYITYNIYNKEDIDTTTLNFKRENNTSLEEKENTTTLNLEIENDTTFTFDRNLLNDWDRLDQDEFVHQRDWMNYLSHTKYYYRTEDEDWSNGYQIVDDDYFRLYWSTTTMHDGNKRRRNLFERMCLRKLINPDITPMELTVNTMIDIIRSYDNRDGVLNSDFIERNVTTTMSMTLEEIEDRYRDTLTYLRSTTRPKKGIIYYSRKHMKEINYSILDEYYDTSKTVKENILLLEQCNFTIKKDTLYKWLRNRNIKSDPNKLSEDELILLTDYSLTANKNYMYIKSLGYKIGNKRYNEFYNRTRQQH